MNKKILATTLGLGLVLTLSACNGPKKPAENVKNNAEVTTENKTNNTDNKTNVTANKAETEAATETTKGAVAKDLKEAKITKEEAFDNFKKLHADTKVESFGLERERADLLYKIDGYDAEKEYEVTIDAETGDVVKDEFEAEKTQGKVADLQKNMLASIDGFVEKALADAGAGFVATDYTLEYDDGKYIVEVEVEKDGKDISYAYDVASGNLIEKDM